MKLNPLLSANPVSKLFFCWLNGLFKKGYNKTLEVADLYDVCQEDSSEVLGNNVEKAWADELKKSSDRNEDASLLKTLLRMFGFQYSMITALLFIEEATKFVQPVLLGEMLRYFTPEPGISQTEVYLYAMGVSLCAILQALLYHPYSFFVYRLGMKIRLACCALIYRKCLRLSSSGLCKTTTGQTVNLMSNDVNKIDLCVTLLPFLFVGPILAVAVIAILWHRIGKPMLAGLAVLGILVVVQIFMSKLFSNFRLRTARQTDRRLTVMNEIIAGIRIIKMYCWETSFRDLVTGIRRSEIHTVRLASYLSAFLETVSRQGRYFCIYATVLFYVLTGDQFRASELYIIVGLLNALSMHSLLFVALAIKHAVQANVTFRRITSFLKLDELHSELQGHEMKSEVDSDTLATTQIPMGTKVALPLTVCEDNSFISIECVTATWDETAKRPTLQNISAAVSKGQLVVVIGEVGSGKSSLLLAILKELPLTEGTVRHSGRLAYVSQQAWVFSSSIRENIIFGGEFDQRTYTAIIKACALDKDMALLPYGDETLIGDRGVRLSGGQRARISLARALYTNGDIYLLDDPFSAVDTNVAEHIFENVIQGILKNKPKILVTHSLQFLSAADNIIILKQGKVLSSGTYDALSHSGVDFASLLKRADDGNAKEDSFIGGEDELNNLKKTQIKQRRRSSKAMCNEQGHTILRKTTFELNPVSSVKGEEKSERFEKGTVSWRIYLNYLKSGAGFIKGLFLIALCLLSQAIFIGSDWWLSTWSNENEATFAKGVLQNSSNTTSIPLMKTNHQFVIYSGLFAGIIVSGLFRAFLFFQISVKAGVTLHNKMFGSLFRAPISFFDTNPVGRVLNRFSKDLGQVDEVLPLSLFDFLQCLLIIVGMVIMTGVVNPWVFIAILPLSVLLVLVRHYYLQTSRQLQRLEGVTRSPVFSHLSATLQGLHTIRAFGNQRRLIKEFDTHQDLHSSAWFLFVSTARWLNVRLDWLCALFVTAVSFASVLAAGSLDAGFVGFSMTYAFAVMGIFQWTVRQSTTVENQMVSVERIIDYCKLPSEATIKRRSVVNWPTEGQISANNVNLKYFDDSPCILKNLTMTINGREKIGIVGRTGAGKSSIITMLMRLVEFHGTVTIDGVNIQDIGLQDLRNRISVIPQDPVLFTGKLRRNLDPFGEHGDEALWQVLEEVEMKETIEHLPLGLDANVSEDGINFSVGQRQLICLARAMLRNNKILIIDEATANVDSRTDTLIQSTIRKKFDQCTVLTIAHRLYTVMDSDRLMVLDQGSLVEFDHPFVLMQKTEGVLHNLVVHMRQGDVTQLLQSAKKAYNRKYHSESNTGNEMMQNSILENNTYSTHL